MNQPLFDLSQSNPQTLRHPVERLWNHRQVDLSQKAPTQSVLYLYSLHRLLQEEG